MSDELLPPGDDLVDEDDDEGGPDAENWFAAGNVCFARGDHDGAIEAYFEALRLEPEHAGVRLAMAKVHLERDAFADAIVLLRGVLTTCPTDHEVMTLLAWAQLWNEEPEEAAKTFRRVLLRTPRHTPAHVGLGWAHMAEAPPALGRAADAFAKAIALETDDPEAYFGLATVCELRDEPAQAVPLLEHMLRDQPDERRALEGLARVHEGLGQWEQAASYLMRLAHLFKDEPDFPRRLARLFEANGAPDRAAVFWQKYRALVPEDREAAASLGDALLSADRAPEAIELLQEALAMHPEDAERHARLGHACFYAGRLDEAIASYARAASLEPGSVHHFYNLGNTYLEASEPGHAITAFQHALSLDPTFHEARVGLGWACYGRDNLETARECFELALGQVPDDVAAMDGLASTHWKEGRVLAALPLFERARMLDPEAGGLRLKLGMILEELGRYEDARRILTELVSGSYAEDRAAVALARVEAKLGGARGDAGA